MTTTPVPLPTIGTRRGPAHARLQDDLAAAVDGEVRFDAGSKGAYATDASNFRQVPIGVVVPRTTDALVRAVEVCAAHDVPITHRGGGTSLAGQCCNAAVIIDGSKHLRRILDLDPEARTARVEPGVLLDHLRDAASAHGLTFGPDPATHDHCTLGGMIGNNSCGVHSVMAGRTADNVIELEVLTSDGERLVVGATEPDELDRIVAAGGRRGEIYAGLRDLRDRHAEEIRARYPDIPRRVSGYNLDELLPEKGFHVARALVGTEGTCVTVLSATVRLVPEPPARTTLVLGYPDVYSAADHVTEVMEAGPVGLEGIDHQLVDDMQRKDLHAEDLDLLPEGRGWLLVEFGGQTRDEADEAADALVRRLGADGPTSKRYDEPAQEARIWEIRKSGLGATARVPARPDTWPGWEDSAVPPERLGDYLRDLKALYREHGVDGSLYGHFGQGCVHTRITFDLETPGGVEAYRRFLDDAADLVVSYGGSLSGEHGDGQQRASLLPKMYGDDLVRAFGEFKALWDPAGRMNPGKVVHPARPDQHLRLGADHQPRQVRTELALSADDGSLSRAAQRCVGVGECRRTDGGVMCPSYMVTLEEEHSTRGRARLLFEMLNGDEVDGVRSDAVEESLDLCLACKGCKSDCPVDVDMASYKAEFMAHRYRRRLRPRPAYAMGLISWWARLASKAPRLVNALTANRLLHPLLMRAAGLTTERPVPRFAEETMVHRLAERSGRPRRLTPRGEPGPTGPPTSGAPRGRVVLWPDTFTNHLHPDAGVAAAEVLEALGYEVVLPPKVRCCGRPLFDYGMLRLARRWLATIVDDLRDEIRAGTPLVGLEPSCLAVFRDELTELLPQDLDARRLAGQAVTLGELLDEHLDDLDLPDAGRAALLHPHCHHHAVMGLDAEHALLGAAGFDVTDTDAGCCGLAGSFGFEAAKHDVSVAVGERALAPRVRDADPDTELIADGFSCRTQVDHLTGRRARHTAEVLRDVLADAGRL
ncbi:MAG: FAD-binding protein [Acidimicrobiales bacterium]|nr:FAD-binding protein [Acidimicrobiales bacterium]